MKIFGSFPNLSLDGGSNDLSQAACHLEELEVIEPASAVFESSFDNLHWVQTLINDSKCPDRGTQGLRGEVSMRLNLDLIGKPSSGYRSRKNLERVEYSGLSIFYVLHSHSRFLFLPTRLVSTDRQKKQIRSGYRHGIGCARVCKKFFRVLQRMT